MGQNAKFSLFVAAVAVLVAVTAVVGSLTSCSGAHATQSAPRAGAALTVLDGDGNTLPDSAGRIESTSDGYTIYASDPRAAGFELRYDTALRVMQVHRGEFFDTDDPFLAISPRSGALDIGGYRRGDQDVPAGGELVARVALMGGGELQRVLSSLPVKPAQVAAAFGYTDNGDGSATFRWNFHSTGDYNQDGEVNISDITPLGVALGKSSTDAGWASASLADGDANGEVNISDLSPIGANYGTQLNGYKLERAGTETGTYGELANVLLGDGTKSPGLSFSYTDKPALDNGWYRVRSYADADATQGVTTAPLQIDLTGGGGGGGNPPVADFTFAPAAPMAGDNVQFTDASTGATSWNWTFGDGGSSVAQNPAHLYTTAGDYTVTLVAHNADGSSQASYQVSVAALPVPDDPAKTFVQEASATLNGAGTQFTIHSTDEPNGVDVIFGPLTQGEQPKDNNLNITYPYRGGLNDPATPHPDIKTKLGYIGITVAGMVIYGPSNASYININGTKWDYDANQAKINGEDQYGGHCSQVNGGQYHYHDVAFITKNAWVSVPDFDGVYARGDGHSKLIGWAEDGYPIYGPYGYVDPMDPSSGVMKMTPSWEATDTGANRPPDVDTTAAQASNNSKYIVLPSDPKDLKIDPGMHITQINGVAVDPPLYIVNQKNVNYIGGGRPPYTGPTNSVELNRAVTVAQGDTLKCEFLAGLFIEDNVFTGTGTLDRYNGRYCVTPDYPGGTYAYFCTMDDAGEGLYPYMIGPELYGSQSVGGTPGTGYVKPTT
jgi:PKD repeat protein